MELEHRLLRGEEQLAVLGYPCVQALASAAQVVTWLFLCFVVASLCVVVTH